VIFLPARFITEGIKTSLRLTIHRRGILSLAILLLIALPLMAAGSLEDKTTAYFVDHYGPAKSSSNVGKANCARPERGIIAVKGQFSIRRFKAGDMDVSAVFLLPSLKLASASYSLHHAWTDEQISAALMAYGADWKPTYDQGFVKSWVTPDGTVAIYILTTLHIQSKTFTELGEKTSAENDAQKKAVPKF
jgi:hypothetical protein